MTAEATILVQGANRAPNAAVSASPTYGDVPLEVSLDGSDSNDPDLEDAVRSYLWTFGEGSQALETTISAANHTCTEAGAYTATLTARDESGAENTSTSARRPEPQQARPSRTPQVPIPSAALGAMTP
jgi:PKD repeat protein